MPPISDRAYLKQEMAKRELARKSYRWYLYYVHGQQWRRTKMSDFLANTVHMPGSLTTLSTQIKVPDSLRNQELFSRGYWPQVSSFLLLQGCIESLGLVCHSPG